MFFTMVWPVAFGLIAVVVTVIGLLAISKIGTWSKQNVNLFTFVAVGMLITLCLTHVIPVAQSISQNALVYVLIGFFIGLASQHLLQSHSNRIVGDLSVSSTLPVFAIAIHSFIDGIIYSVSFATNHTSGLSVSLALVIHEFPEVVITYAVLQRFNLSARMLLVWTFFVAGVTTFIGTLISAPIAHLVDDSLLGIPFALSGGLLLYVATGPLVTSIKTESALKSLPALATGIIIAFALTSVHVHGHEQTSAKHNHFEKPQIYNR